MLEVAPGPPLTELTGGQDSQAAWKPPRQTAWNVQLSWASVTPAGPGQAVAWARACAPSCGQNCTHTLLLSHVPPDSAGQATGVDQTEVAQGPGTQQCVYVWRGGITGEG
jgi:hypothetical protein